MLLRKADGMFPEGQGAPRAFAKEGTPAEKTNELLENATIAIDQLFKRRGYDPKKPEEVGRRARAIVRAPRGPAGQGCKGIYGHGHAHAVPTLGEHTSRFAFILGADAMQKRVTVPYFPNLFCIFTLAR